MRNFTQSASVDPAITISAEHMKNETLGLNNLFQETQPTEKLEDLQDELAKKLGLLEKDLEDRIEGSEVMKKIEDNKLIDSLLNHGPHR
jgi:hypothetical protein